MYSQFFLLNHKELNYYLYLFTGRKYVITMNLTETGQICVRFVSSEHTLSSQSFEVSTKLYFYLLSYSLSVYWVLNIEFYSRGTHGYMAPEVLSKGTAYDSSADWFSFGCMLYKLLKGHSPFRQHKTKDKHEIDRMTLTMVS